MAENDDQRQHGATAGAVALVVVLGLWRMASVTMSAPSLEAAAASAAETTAATVAQERQAAQSHQAPTGMTLAAPRIGLAAPIVELGTGDDNELDAPKRFDEAGWWSSGIRPGAAGPAVVAGHVDSAEGPAVFHRLHELVPGDEVTVTHADGRLSRFVVTRSAQVEKSRFPTAEVYGKISDPELRLITCSGPFDQTSRHYTDNLIVFASLVP